MKSYKLGNIEELFISKKDIEERLNQNDIFVDENGVLEDKFYGKNIQRSILLTSTEAYELIKQNHLGTIAYGKLGENILVDFPLGKLCVGDQLKIGEVILEISQNCTLCSHLSKIHKDLPELLIDHRGIFAKAIKGGTIEGEENIYHIGNVNG